MDSNSATVTIGDLPMPNTYPTEIERVGDYVEILLPVDLGALGEDLGTATDSRPPTGRRSETSPLRQSEWNVYARV